MIGIRVVVGRQLPGSVHPGRRRKSWGFWDCGGGVVRRVGLVL